MFGGEIMIKKDGTLFLDIEWVNNKGDFSPEECEVLSVGAIGYHGGSKQNFYTLVKPSDMLAVTPRILELLRLDKTQLEGARPVGDVLKSLSDTFEYCAVIVVWSKSTYDLLCQKCSENDIPLFEHRVVFMQELVGLLDSNNTLLSFEKAMRRYGVKYLPNLLHNASYDVLCLMNLFCVVRKSHKKNHGFGRRCFVGDENSGLIHSPYCEYAENTEPDNIYTVSAAKLFEGYHNCELCGGVMSKLEWVENEKKFRSCCVAPYTDEDIGWLCDKLGLDYKSSSGVFFIKTGYSSWRIMHNYDEVERVFHENYRGLMPKRKEKFNTGYHRQNVISKDIWEVLRYIYNHDKRYITTLIGQKNRVDMLLEQIEKENEDEINL
jgi:DNA polymerase III epsilon subunit-like protein